MPIPAILATLATAVAPKIADSIGTAVDKLIPDRDLGQKMKHELATLLVPAMVDQMNAARDIIVAEAQGGSWLQRSWRPLTMLTFTGLIVAKWLGFTAPGIDPSVEAALLDIIKVGLGGYVVGRSVEKGIEAWKR